MLRIDAQNTVATALSERLKTRIDFEALPSELCVVIGGDGFMLETIRTVGAGHVFLGLNAGRVGFLLNDAEDFESTIEAIEGHRWQVHTFPRLAMRATHTGDNSISEAMAVNDVYLERMSGQTAHLQIEINNVPVVNRLVCDGIIASTALGSTAYPHQHSRWKT